MTRPYGGRKAVARGMIDMNRKIIVGAQHIACITGGESGTALRIFLRLQRPYEPMVTKEYLAR